MTTNNQDTVTDNGAVRKSSYHDLAHCEALDKPTVDNAERYIEKEGYLFELVNVIENTATSCPKRHNSDTLVYELVQGAIGYDNI